MFNRFALMFTAVLAGSACTTQQSTPPAEAPEGFSMLKHDGTTLEATLTSGGASVRVLVTETTPDVVELTYDFGDPVIGFRIDYREGAGEFQPSGAPLDAAQSLLVDALLGQLEELPSMQGDQRPRIDDVALRMTSFMQIVPTGEPLAAHPFLAEKGWSHISCSCSRQYLGSGDYRTCGRGCSCGGGNGCKGRCGGGCGGVGRVAYTRDCGRHDHGIGSWSAASDDFSFASNNCSGGC